MRAKEHAMNEFRTSDGMFIVSSNQLITSWNAMAEKLLGHPEDQVIGKRCYEVLCAADSPGRLKCNRSCAVVTNAAKGRTTRDFDLECKSVDGSNKLLNVSILLADQPAGDRQVVHLFRDVTDRRNVERAVVGNRAQDPLNPADTVEGLTPGGYRLPPLTTREDQVLRLLAAGKNTTDISEILAIRPLTARNHVSRLLTKLGCRSRLEAVALGTRAGLI